MATCLRLLPKDRAEKALASTQAERPKIGIRCRVWTSFWSLPLGEGDGRPGVLEKPQFARAWHGTPQFDKFRFDDRNSRDRKGAQAW